MFRKIVTVLMEIYSVELMQMVALWCYYCQNYDNGEQDEYDNNQVIGSCESSQLYIISGMVLIVVGIITGGIVACVFIVAVVYLKR